MKIVHVVYPGFIYSQVGASTNLLNFTNNISQINRHGIDYTIYSYDILNIPNPSFIGRNNFNTKIKKRIVFYLNKFQEKSAFISWLFIKRSLDSAKNIVMCYLEQNPSPDIIDFQEIFSCFYYLKSIKSKEAKVVLFHHGNGETFKMFKIYYPKLANSTYYKELIKMQDFVLDKIDKYIFISDIARNTFLNIHKDFPAEKTAFFHNGIPCLTNENKIKLEYLISKRDYAKYNLICVGTLNNRKGQEFIITALSNIDLKIREKITITFLGDGNKTNDFINLAKKLNVEKSIRFEGGVKNVNDYLGRANIYILASKDEGLPISIIEAMRARLPIIGSNVAGIPEMIDHEVNGLLIEPSVDSVALVLNNLEKYDWKKMGENAFKTFETKFTLNKMIDNYCEIINKLGPS